MIKIEVVDGQVKIKMKGVRSELVEDLYNIIYKLEKTKILTAYGRRQWIVELSDC